ncbi:MAG: hypothetical protein ACLFRX_06790, partial [Gemmatimonadota bacterium]
LEEDATWAELALAAPLPVLPSAGVSGAVHRGRATARVATATSEVRRAGGRLGLVWRGFDPDLTAAIDLIAEHVEAEHRPGGRGPRGFSAGPALHVHQVGPLVRAVGIDRVLRAELRFGDVGYWAIEAGGSLAFRAGPLSMAPLLHLAAVAEEAPLDAVPALGDRRLVPAVRRHEDHGHRLAVAGLDLSHPIPWQGTVRLRARTGVADDLGSGRLVWRTGAGVSVLWWTPFGQIELGAEGTLEDARLVVQLGPEW